jgi:hypothetical protein
MATKERLAAMAASLCAVCSGSMVINLVEATQATTHRGFALTCAPSAAIGEPTAYLPETTSGAIIRVLPSFVGALGDYLGMTVDVAAASARRVEASSAWCFALRGTVYS